MIDTVFGPLRRREKLSVFPLLSPEPQEVECDLLSDALAAGTLEITEVGGGTVPRLLAKNTGPRKVLILDGEQLIGARQNRTTNRSILLPAQSETEIPVSCMEAGRWSSPRDRFGPSKYHSPAKVRRKARDMEAAEAEHGRTATDSKLSGVQGEVWSEVYALGGKLGFRSPTEALNEVFGSRESDLEEGATSFPAVEGQVGLLVLAGNRPIGLDMVGEPALYRKLHARLLRGYLLDGLDADALGTVDSPGGPEARPAGRGAQRSEAELEKAADAFWQQVSGAERVRAPTVGLGQYSVLAHEAVGGELVEGEQLYHLSAFPHISKERREERWPT